MSTALLQTTYFGPIQWYQKLYRYDHCLIEQYDSYQKQTYRNRCIIATANGLQALTVPVEHETLNMKHETLKGAVSIGMLYKVPIAKALSLTTMLMISILSSRRNMNSSSISTRQSVRKCASCWIFTLMSAIHQTSDFRHQTSPTSAKSSMPNIHNQTRTSRLNAIGRSLRESTTFKPISRYSTSSLTWDQNLFFIYKPYLFILNSKTV